MITFQPFVVYTVPFVIVYKLPKIAHLVRRCADVDSKNQFSCNIFIKCVEIFDLLFYFVLETWRYFFCITVITQVWYIFDEDTMILIGMIHLVYFQNFAWFSGLLLATDFFGNMVLWSGFLTAEVYWNTNSRLNSAQIWESKLSENSCYVLAHLW